MGIPALLLLGGIIQPLWSTSLGRGREEQGRGRRSWRCLLANKGLCAQTLFPCLSPPGSVCSANTANSPAFHHLIQSAKANLTSHVPNGLLSPHLPPKTGCSAPALCSCPHCLLFPPSPQTWELGKIRLRCTRWPGDAAASHAPKALLLCCQPAETWENTSLDRVFLGCHPCPGNRLKPAGKS